MFVIIWFKSIIMAQKEQQQLEVEAFIYARATELLTASGQQSSEGNQSKDEIHKSQLVLADTTKALVCYVSKIDVRNNFVEVCDTNYAIKCTF